MTYNRSLTLILAISLFCAVSSMSDNTFTNNETEWSNWNNEGVLNGPPSNDTIFSVETPFTVIYLDAYHYNNGMGTNSPGTLGFVSDDRTTYGPWETEGIIAYNNSTNGKWIARPNETLPAGTYTVFDSDPDTWSNNNESGNAGFSKIQWTIETESVSPEVILTPESTNTLDTSIFSETTNPSVNTQILADFGSIWKISETGGRSGTWTRNPNQNSFQAKWTSGNLSEVINILSVNGKKITLESATDKTQYSGTLSPDNKGLSGVYDDGHNNRLWVARLLPK